MMKKPKKAFCNFILLWSGELISAIGSGLTSFGLSVYVFHLTGNASSMALVTLLAFVPALVLSPIAGVLADRYDRRLLMILGDGLSATGLLFILFCMVSGQGSLWQICIGVTVSSVFSSLMEPAYKATVTDLLTPSQYTKASGLVGIASSAKYLFSPMIAGLLLAVSDIKLLLILDIVTFFITVAVTLIVRKGLKKPQGIKNTSDIAFNKSKSPKSILIELKAGFHAVSKNRGVLLLVIMGAVITMFLGFIQTLSAPMVLAFASSATLGIAETICATGMLVSSILIGAVSIKKGYAKILSVALFFAGFFMVIFGLRENIAWICISGFLFFATLPFANSSLDYMLRNNIANELQGRAWGFIGVISQLGYVVAYAFSGMLADGAGRAFGIGVGRGAGLCIIISGVLLSCTAVLIHKIKSLKQLENGGEVCTTEF